MTTDQGYKKVLQRHLKETQDQVTNIQDRLDELGGDTGGVLKLVSGATTLARDAIGQVLVLSKGPLDAVRTPNQQERMLKNAKDECATEALEIATYDALEATAQAAGDTKTAKLAADHRKQEEKMLADLLHLNERNGPAFKIKNDPRVQEKAQQATDLAKEKAPVVKDKLTEAAGAATEKVKATAGGGSDDAVDTLNPDRIKVTDDNGPQGTLP